MIRAFLIWLGKLLGHDRPLFDRLLSLEQWETQNQRLDRLERTVQSLEIHDAHQRLDNLEAAIRAIEDYDAVLRHQRRSLPDDPLDNH